MDKIKIAFFSNFLNHHQALVAEELYRKTEGRYVFVELMPMPEWIAKSGYPDYSNQPFLLQAWRDDVSMAKAKELAIEAEVALFAGYEVLEFEKYRIANTNKITFDVSERWLKRGVVNLLSPRILKLYLSYKLGRWDKKSVYKLCSSAFAATDHKKLNMYRDRCYKWGYFTKVPEVVKIRERKSPQEPITMMWCARFLDWKHPEMPILLASRLRESGYHFQIDMFGSGVLYDDMKVLATKLNVNSVISFCGNKPNTDILEEMGKHDIFLFTSDKNEGWGAVCNEAMSNGCVVVGSDEIGSVPFLVQDNVDGCVFKSRNIGSLVDRVQYLLDHRDIMCTLQNNAIHKMQTIWSPTVAAKQLLTLINDLQNGRASSIQEGPCSKA